MAHCYAELAVSSPAVVAETIASTHCTYSRRDGQAEWPGIGRDDRPTKGLSNPNPIQVLTGIDVI